MSVCIILIMCTHILILVLGVLLVSFVLLLLSSLLLSGLLLLSFLLSLLLLVVVVVEVEVGRPSLPEPGPPGRERARSPRRALYYVYALAISCYLNISCYYKYMLLVKVKHIICL